MVMVMASDSQIKACRQAGKVWRGKLLFGVSFHVAPGQIEGKASAGVKECVCVRKKEMQKKRGGGGRARGSDR